MTREVPVGSVIIGGNHPIRIQSMINTAPEDTEGTIHQIIKLSEAGSELIRLTVPSLADARRIEKIRNTLTQLGNTTPLIADVHFNPDIAEICATYFDKVRINPGNYGISSQKETRIRNEKDWDDQLTLTEERILPLIDLCKKNHTAIRIGSNHGSLSPRIIHRYGDTPEGMVEAALEFLRIFDKHDFHNIVLSMKSSNVRVMVQAYRLLVMKMELEGFHHPLHLGVTEAGFGEEGRIKSASGTGVLLDEGIGDTLRVSLTEDPVEEIPVARQIIQRYDRFQSAKKTVLQPPWPFNPTEYHRRDTLAVGNIGASAPPVVLSQQCNAFKTLPDIQINRTTGLAMNRSEIQFSLIDHHQIYLAKNLPDRLFMLNLPVNPSKTILADLKQLNNTLLLVSNPADQHSGLLKKTVALLEQSGIKLPLIVCIEALDFTLEETVINTSITASSLLTDGLADGIWLKGSQDPVSSVELSFKILQATRARITTTEYISCPSCGRTRFDIQKAAVEIKKRTEHLKGLKIGIMGCVVNGPGEMADADYGYVGAGNHTINLYKGKEVMKKGIQEYNAIDELIALIRRSGDWIEPIG